MDDGSHLNWPNGSLEVDEPHDRFTASVRAVSADGGPYGAGVAVMRAWRTDVDLEDDVPVFGQETDANTASEFV